MMRIVYGSIVLLAVALSATCAAKTGPIDTHGTDMRKGTKPVRAKIVIQRSKENSAKCVARTFPKKIEIDPEEDDGVIWTIRQKPGSKCLPDGVNIELRWVGSNPTACEKLGTWNDKAKAKFECDLGRFDLGAKYTYKLYRVGEKLEEEVEDPEIEIVVF